MQYEWQVSRLDGQLTLLEFLKRRFKDKDFSLRKIKGWIDAGFCTVAGRPQRFSRTQLVTGERVVLFVPEKQAPVQMLFIYEDDAILVLDKPAGITCDERLVADLAKKNKHIELVHRLDKETTGLLICAKTADVKKYFIQQFRALAVQKSYIAIVDGLVQENNGDIQNYLGPIQRYQGHVKWGVVSSDGHLASSHWHVLKRGKKTSLLHLEPKTGKTHQLRVHTSGMGHPILGDFTYSKTFSCTYKAPRILLHAKTLAFLHPQTHEMMQLSSELPKDIEACLKELF